MNDRMERWLKLLPIALGAVYSAGFLIVGAFLARYGASSLSLFRIQYFAAGFWCAVVFVAYFVPVLSARRLFSEMFEINPANDTRTLLFVRLAISALMLGIFVGMISLTRRLPFLNNDRPFTRVMLHGEAIRFVLTMFAVDVLTQITGWLRRQADNPSYKQGFRGHGWRMLMLITCITLLGTVADFGLMIYPTIPFSLGGGEARVVIFVLKDKEADAFLRRDGDSPYTIPYKLLIESDSSLVVVSPKDGQKAIEFDRKIVSAVIVLGKLREDLR